MRVVRDETAPQDTGSPGREVLREASETVRASADRV